MSYSKPIQMLVDEHAVITSVLEAVQIVARRNDGEFQREFFEKAFDFFPAFADKFHHAKEEAILFPVLQARGIPRDGGPIGCMLKEHDQGRAHVAGVKQALERAGQGDREAQARVRREALAYVALLREHIDKENNILYLMGENCMTGADREGLVGRFESAGQEALPPDRRSRYLAIAEELRAEAGL